MCQKSTLKYIGIGKHSFKIIYCLQITRQTLMKKKITLKIESYNIIYIAFFQLNLYTLKKNVLFVCNNSVQRLNTVHKE